MWENTNNNEFLTYAFQEVEIIRCPKCNSLVPNSYARCYKCGQPLQDAKPVKPTETLRKMLSPEERKISPTTRPVKGSAEASDSKSRSSSPRISTVAQYRHFKQAERLKEDAGRSALNQGQSQDMEEPQKAIVRDDASKVVGNDVPEVEEMMPQKVEAEVIEAKLMEAIKEEESAVPNEVLGSYSPDPNAREIVEKMAKQLKNEVNLIQFFKDGQMPEEMFTRLFNSMTNDITNLIARREAAANELIESMKGYESIVLSAQQGIKLFDLRKSIGDVSEEEYDIKTAALSWDIDHYGQKILEGQQKADYFRSLSNLLSVDEVNNLKKMAASCLDASFMKNISEDVRVKIKKAIQGASPIFNEVYES